MLLHTFSHIPGIGPATEKKLWKAGVSTWHDWGEVSSVKLSAATKLDAITILEQSIAALDDDPCYFTDKLSGAESWRIFHHYREQIAYIDIETTGMADFSEITTIALYDGKEVKCYVNGENLEEFVDDICQYKVIVSYNGKSFDVPFLEKHFNIKLEQAQIDLRYVLARLGFKGGLKGCEKQLGLNRGNLDGVDGYFAVLLWREYEKYGDQRVLDTLLAYNIEDTVNLERLAVEAYNRHVITTPFAEELALECPLPPPNPFIADFDTVERLKQSLQGWTR